ncbi:MAG TPA: hypothetical protein VFT41_13020, partial [Gemmatimonadaceae bacterium]|nr:hypothetical protein [Gemmatimonadaceae bacterium]
HVEARHMQARRGTRRSVASGGGKRRWRELGVRQNGRDALGTQRRRGDGERDRQADAHQNTSRSDKYVGG